MRPSLWIVTSLLAATVFPAAPPVSAQTFVRGDIDFDGLVDVGDVIDGLGFLYEGMPPVPNPGDAGDVNDNGIMEISDIAYLLRFLFVGGASAPPAPFPSSGLDSTPPSFPVSANGSLSFRLTDTTGCLGSPAVIELRVTHLAPLEALNIRFSFDPAEVSYAGGDATPLETILGTTVDFFDEDISADFVEAGIVFDFTDPTGSGLPPQSDAVLLNLSFDLDPGLSPGTNVIVALGNDPGANPPSYNMGSVLGEMVLADLVGNATIAVTCFPSDATFSIETPAVAVPGQSTPAALLLSNSVAVEAFSFGLTFDTAQLDLSSAIATGRLAAVNGNTGPDFLDIDLAPTGGGGITVECDVTTSGVSDSISTGSGPIFDLLFDVAPTAGPPCTVLSVAFTDALGSPPVPIVSIDGSGIPAAAATFGASIEIGTIVIGSPSGGVEFSAETVEVTAGTNAVVRVLLDSDVAIEAFSFGLVYDPTDLAISSITTGAALGQVGCGTGPDYFLSTPLVGGLTVASVFDLSGPFDGATLPVGSGQDLALLEFSTNATPTTVGSALTFSDQLGTGVLPVAIEATVNGAAITPTTVDGAVDFFLTAVNFRRGDCNDDGMIDISDAIYFLGFLFPGGTPSPPLACDDACDGNDDGALNIADGITILASLFGSPAVPLPGPSSCGSDPTADSLGCAAASTCP